MGGFDDGIPIPDIPIHVFVIIGCVAALLAGSPLLGLWLTGFKKPTPSEPLYIRTLHDKLSSSTLIDVGGAALRVPPAAATRLSGEIIKSEEKKSLDIEEPEEVEDSKEPGEVEESKEPGKMEESKENVMTEDTNGGKEIEEIDENRGPKDADEITGIKEKEET
ncbi:hypothetical protein QBC40DRAFT_315469 [Triangularia verruculosa]|uniref:Uncharacterized protein n=1 Tax=Triangularia verruculosa TaxID=2587418 RepID=A0AAN6XQX5_9PEZI|nr:hypothetical protein QBC40DRAFT_315469 [Triangularia verruculosa]